MVIPALGEFRKVHPDVQVDLVITDRALDLENGEADLAIRTGRALADLRPGGAQDLRPRHGALLQPRLRRAAAACRRRRTT